MRNPLYTLLFVLLCASCTLTPSNVKQVLTISEKNKEKLESVIEHYKQEGNEEKLRAAYFLIGNMQDKFSYTGEAVTQFDPIFSILDSLYRKKVKMLTESPIIKAKWDSLTEIYDNPHPIEADKTPDYAIVSPAILIENIDFSYSLWKTTPADKTLTFEQYCEYLLPYHIGTERLEPWMKYLYREFKPFRDTVRAANNFEFAKKLDMLLRKRISLNHTIDKYPYDMTAHQMEQARRGACKHLVNYEAMVMRANGIPVSLEFAPRWGDLNKGHEWLALIDGKKKPYAFNAAQEDFQGFSKTPYRFAKVYRRSFAKQEYVHPKDDQDIPQSLFDDYALDVTAEYTKTTSLAVTLQYPSKFNNAHAILCTYGNEWVPQAWGTINNNRVLFEDIGVNLVYIVMYNYQNKLYPATLPFIVDTAGRQVPISPSAQTQSLTVERKYPYFTLNYRNAVCFLNGRLQVANRPNFNDASDIYTVHEVPTKYIDVVPTSNGTFRYARYIAATGQKTNLAELEFYTLGKTPNDTVPLIGTVIGYPEIEKDLGTPYQNAFDGKPQTYFSGNKDSVSWAGMDFGRAKRIVKIRFCPRSDTNFILIGDEYELLIWEKDHWRLLNKQVATRQSLQFARVPRNGLYLLHDRSHGNEQRIFTYDHNKQVWW